MSGDILLTLRTRNHYTFTSRHDNAGAAIGASVTFGLCGRPMTGPAQLPVNRPRSSAGTSDVSAALRGSGPHDLTLLNGIARL
jgi:hypothetical protein